jgi:hypothetical protein
MSRTLAFTNDLRLPRSLNLRMIPRQHAALIVDGIPAEYSDSEALEVLRALLAEGLIEYGRARWKTAVEDGIAAGVLAEESR